jgi:thiamine-phosphate pyrophosphorylase
MREGPAPPQRAPFDLYLVADARDGGDLTQRTAMVLERLASTRRRGMRELRVGLQLRAKGMPARDLLPLARRLRELTASFDVPLLVNERIDVARVVGADGVHLPEGTFTPAEARAILGPMALVGASCHDAQGLVSAAAGGADFATLGPFAPTPGKGPPLPRHRFAHLASSAALPVLALGGVTAATVSEALSAGAAGVAVLGALYRADDPAAAAETLFQAWLEALPEAPTGEREARTSAAMPLGLSPLDGRDPGER